MQHDKIKVLVDLNIAANNGFCGIATENRYVFKMLSTINSIEINGLVTPARPGIISTKYKTQVSHPESIEKANHFFYGNFKQKNLSKSFLSNLALSRYYFKNQFDIYAMDPIFHDAIWHHVFNSSLHTNDREVILQNKFYLTDLSALQLKLNSYFAKLTRLNTANYDVALFLEPSPIKVSLNTIKVVRYHDSIPITDPNFSSRVYTRRSLNVLKQCVGDSVFVCNSEPTLNSLLKLYPEVEKQSFTIPCLIASKYKKVTNIGILKQILVSKLAKKGLQPEKIMALRSFILGLPELNYLFNLSTLDPRKNHKNLIKAWEKLHYNDPNLKLVLAANPGWLSNEADKLIKPHVERGNIIHLENISADEIPYLFSHAKAFIFPSFAEGFGLPPLEAMQCECPTIVSDIPTHRWVMGDAALYCDPHDPDSIAEVISKLIYSEHTLREDLIRKGLERVKQYSETAIHAQWKQMFEKIVGLRKKR